MIEEIVHSTLEVYQPTSVPIYLDQPFSYYTHCKKISNHNLLIPLKLK